MRNVDALYARIAHCKIYVGAMATRSQNSSMDDTGERIEIPICRDVNARKRFRDEGQLP